MRCTTNFHVCRKMVESFVAQYPAMVKQIAKSFVLDQASEAPAKAKASPKAKASKDVNGKKALLPLETSKAAAARKQFLEYMRQDDVGESELGSNYTESWENVMKLYKKWDAQGCDPAMANCGLSPTEVAELESYQQWLEESYKRDLVEDFSNFSEYGAGYFIAQHQDGLPANFVDACRSFKGPDHWGEAHADCKFPRSAKGKIGDGEAAAAPEMEMDGDAPSTPPKKAKKSHATSKSPRSNAAAKAKAPPAPDFEAVNGAGKGKVAPTNDKKAKKEKAPKMEEPSPAAKKVRTNAVDNNTTKKASPKKTIRILLTPNGELTVHTDDLWKARADYKEDKPYGNFYSTKNEAGDTMFKIVKNPSSSKWPMVMDSADLLINFDGDAERMYDYLNATVRNILASKKPAWGLDMPSLEMMINRPLKPTALVWTAKKQGKDLYHLAIPLSSYNKRGDPNESERAIDIKAEIEGLEWSEANAGHYVRGSLALVKGAVKNLRKLFSRAWPEVAVVVKGPAAGAVDTTIGIKRSAAWLASKA